MTDSQSKLVQLAQLEGFDDTEEFLLECELNDSHGFVAGVPGICTNDDCDYYTQVDPDGRKGYCENCNTQTVASAYILAGII